MSHPANESSVDVLVVGAGPAGLMCAYGLAKAGVNVRIVEKRADKIAAGQADGIQPRTIEVLQSYGLAERLLREACQLHRVAFYHPGPNGGVERVARIPDVTAPTARYPFEATLHQGAIEDIFIDAMQPLGLVVERQTVPVSMQLSKDPAELNDPNAYPVKVVLQHLDSNATQGDAETETIHAKFVVGADGAHSWVRKSLGIAMEGAQTEYIWGVLDLVPETDFPDVRSRCAIHSANGSCMIIPREGDGIRLYVQLSDTDVVDPATGRVDPTKMGPSEILEVARRSLHPYTIATPKEFEWSTIYISAYILWLDQHLGALMMELTVMHDTVGQRVASQFSANERVFIAGDACHTHSPKAGQGMNASMSDSHNLVWKLAQVLRGTADMSLLKT
ncbi:FAD-binding monooxygenase, partial [Athelia psychrophila]